MQTSDRTITAGYRLQLTLIDLLDLTLQTQHLRWNLVESNELRDQLDDFDALARASADEVAARLRAIEVPPDGRIRTAYQDLLFEPLPAGPIGPAEAIEAFVHRLNQLGSRVQESRSVLRGADVESAELLDGISEAILAWANRFATGNSRTTRGDQPPTL